MKAALIESRGTTLEDVTLRVNKPMFEVSLRVRMYRTTPIRPRLESVGEGVLGEAVDGFGPGRTLKVSYLGSWTTVVLQPENEDEKRALTGRVYERVEKNEFALVFVPEDFGGEVSILRNRMVIAAVTPGS